MTISWGTKIAALYTGFVLLISTLVWMSMQQKPDLVSEDYYQREVTFQRHLDAVNNGLGLLSPPSVSLSADNILIRFPAASGDGIVNAAARFYAPVNSVFDRTFTYSGSGNEIQVDRKSLAAVRYKVQLSWSAGGKEYYRESDLNLLR